MKWRKIRTLPPEGAQSPPQSPLYVRLLWMTSIWAASVVVLLVLAGVLRLVLQP